MAEKHIADVMKSDDLPNIYFNEFGAGISKNDIFILLGRNGKQEAILNASHITAKSLANALNEPKDKRSVLISQLNSYLLLPYDWDGYDGVAPNRQTVDDAIRLLHLLPKHISIPKPTLGNSGTVGFYWEKENFYAEVCFEGDETFWYYAKDTDNEFGEDVVSLNTNTLPDELILFLEQF
ncbi:MAG: hypothetical protein BWK80_27555 [Desulfobacteraceae bacterium IS3]|nr:MAG: hypothetical protein BWK80_27555 [Desulfobacteraceae bacterium IS3]